MISNNLKLKIQNNFNSIFVIAIIIALFCPYIEFIPNKLTTYLLAIVIFLSISKIDQNDLAHISIKEIIDTRGLIFLG